MRNHFLVSLNFAQITDTAETQCTAHKITNELIDYFTRDQFAEVFRALNTCAARASTPGMYFYMFALR